MIKIKKILQFYNFLLVYLLVLISFNVLLLYLPLTNVFGYEFSAINSIIIVLFSGLFTISLIKKIITEIIKKEIAGKYFRIMAISFLLLPAVISIVHSFLTKSCSFTDGLAFYTVITLPSVLIGTALGFVSVFAVKKFSRILFVILFLAIISIPLFEFYFNPQVYFYNPIFGYFPGTIYDEGLVVSIKLVYYRLANIFYFGIILFILYHNVLSDKRKYKFPTLIFFVLIAGMFEYFSPFLGLSTTFERLQKELNKKIVSSHFIIYYPQSLNNRLVKAITIYHEYYYDELKNFFGYDYPQKIHSYLFLNDKQKKNLFGSANADVAKPWMNSVFITYKDFDPILKHEIAHCYASVFGTGLFKVAAGLNPSLIEGTAVAANPVYNGNTIDFMASLAYNNGYKINIPYLFKGFSFYLQTSSLAYIYAGSFCKFVINKFGINKFKEYYANGNFEKTYHLSLKKEADKYYSYLAKLDVSNKKDEANYYFGTRSIFYKVCPRYVSNRLQKAWSLYYGQNYPEAEKAFKAILGTTNNYSAILGYANCLWKEYNNIAAVKFLKDNINQFKNSAYYYSMELKLGDFYAMNKNFSQADSIYNQLSIQDPNYTYYYLANLRKDLISKDTLIIKYLNGNDFDKYYILKQMNIRKYNYFSFPVMITLSNLYDESYKLFLNQFNRRFNVTGFASSYAMYKLSNYMLQNLDFSRARKLAALALRFSGNFDYNEMNKANFAKANWFYKNEGRILNNISISITQ